MFFDIKENDAKNFFGRVTFFSEGVFFDLKENYTKIVALDLTMLE